MPANAILPVPLPAAPLAHWIAAPARDLESLDVAGATLRGWTFRAQASSHQKLRLLFFNGNGMTVDDAQMLYRALAVRGADVTVFDYRGYGFSSGKAEVMDFRRDALAIYDKLATSGTVVVYGFSMGTAMAAYVASERKVAGLILAGTIASAEKEFPVFASAMGYSPAKIAMLAPSSDAVAAFNELGMIASNTSPLLMIHGEADSLVPIEQGQAVFNASPSRQKRFVRISSATHNDTIESANAMVAVHEFLDMIGRYAKPC